MSYRSQLMLAYEFAPICLRQYVIQNKLMLSALDLITMATHIAKVRTSCFNTIVMGLTDFTTTYDS